MKELYILRHGLAVPYGTPGIPDDQRPLTREGEKRIMEIARGLVRLKLAVDSIVTSPLPRARRTAQIVANELEWDDRLETATALSAGASAPSIAGWLRGRAEKRLMIVGHNPALSELVGLLVLGQTGQLHFELKKGGVAALSPIPGGEGCFQLDWTAPPALLRRLA